MLQQWRLWRINIPLDSPVPYCLDALLGSLKEKDTEMVPGARGEKQGPYNGKLTRFIQRLETKQKDKRLNFMFSTEESLLSYTYMGELCEKLMAPSVNGEKGVKIIDFSEVPSDILPLIVSLIASNSLKIILLGNIIQQLLLKNAKK